MIKKLSLLIISLFLCSCMSLERLKKTHNTSEGFNGQLSRMYLKLAESEAEEYDWYSSEHFARKGLRAARHQIVMPDAVSKFVRKGHHLKELTTAREELEILLTDEVKARHPHAAAKALSSFDCWLEEAGEGWQTDKINHCKHEFIHAINAIKGKHHIVGVNLPNDEYNYTIHFGLGNACLEKHAMKLINKAAHFIKHLKNQPTIIVKGYADTTGSAMRNEEISAMRANTVKEKLVSLGVNKKNITTEYHGDRHLAVPTGKNVAEKLNRRVKIDIMD